MVRVGRILVIVLVMTAIALCDPGDNGKGKGKGKGRQSRSKNGQYALVVVGYFTGSGTAEVRDDSLSLDINVTGDNGANGKLTAELPINGPYFRGTGTALGQPIEISGRLDAAKASRLVASYNGGKGANGRIVGRLPTDSGDEEWEKDDDD